jgi:O-antigen ligase
MILCAAVAVAPLPFGSTDPVIVAFWCLILGVATVMTTPRHLHAPHLVLIGVFAVMIVAWTIVLGAQLSTHAFVPSASVYGLWRQTADALDVALDPSVSIVRSEPFFALGAPLAAMLSGTCSLIVCVDRRRARKLLRVVAWSGAVYAAYGIISFLIDPTKVLWREKEAYTTVLTATFINRNTAAVFFGSCAALWLLTVCEWTHRRLPGGQFSWRAFAAQLLAEAPRDVVVPFFMFFVCLIAMFMTGSRAGVVLSLFVLIISFVLFFYRELPRRRGVLVSMAMGGLVALILLQILGPGVSGRFDQEGLADGGRLETYRSTVRMIADNPWLGTGLGTYVWSFPAYRGNNSFWGVWDRAHNTLLELAAELGLPFAGMVLAGWLMVLAVLIYGVKVRRRDRIVPIAALSVSLLAVLHSLIDFSLQIPGYAIMVFAIAASGLSQSFRVDTKV